MLMFDGEILKSTFFETGLSSAPDSRVVHWPSLYSLQCKWASIIFSWAPLVTAVIALLTFQLPSVVAESLAATTGLFSGGIFSKNVTQNKCSLPRHMIVTM